MAKKLVNFRLPESLLNALKARALDEGISTTDLLIRFCEQGLGLVNTTVPTDVKTVTTQPLDERIDSRILAAIAPLASKIEGLAAELEKLEA